MYTLRFDGLYRGIPAGDGLSSKAGLLCYGWLIGYGGQQIARGHGACVRGQDASSNVAEYLALIEGLDALSDLGVQGEPVIILGDAQTIIDQMRGVSLVHSPNIRSLYRQAQRLARRFTNLAWLWTPRRENKAADLLTRKAMRQVRSEFKTYQKTLQAIGPEKSLADQSNRIRTLMDLRVYQPSLAPVPTRPARPAFASTGSSLKIHTLRNPPATRADGTLP